MCCFQMSLILFLLSDKRRREGLNDLDRELLDAEYRMPFLQNRKSDGRFFSDCVRMWHSHIFYVHSILWSECVQAEVQDFMIMSDLNLKNKFFCIC